MLLYRPQIVSSPKLSSVTERSDSSVDSWSFVEAKLVLKLNGCAFTSSLNSGIDRNAAAPGRWNTELNVIEFASTSP